ncbi:hypothetical protein HMPREF0972_01605 [Actinomyces sp. oral taxon 848 str. F0332]|nr:hypothetical protein HMPREF0972_01605 [Actinomyces sp. oral taxon 848 str. F0332]
MMLGEASQRLRTKFPRYPEQSSTAAPSKIRRMLGYGGGGS